MPSDEEKKKKPPKVINGKYEITKKLGAGCFGEVYLGQNKEDGTPAAIKVEDVSAPAPQLEQEYETIRKIRSDSDPQGFVKAYYYGVERSSSGQYNCFVMELLGKSLEDMVQKCDGKFTAKTTALIAHQVIARIEFLHSRCFVHRDIKPENFMFGYSSKEQSKEHIVYIIDFGLSKKYWGDKGPGHSAMRTKLSLTGTARYASINAHKGMEQSRRDDLEAIGHMFMYFLRGSVPWSGLDAKTKNEKYRKIMEKKAQFPLDELCKGFPKTFEKFLEAARNMEFLQRPDYDEWKKAFVKVSEQEDAKNLWDYQWFDGKPPPQEKLVPLAKTGKIRQPDDPEETPPAKVKSGGLCGCFPGASKRTIVEGKTD